MKHLGRDQALGTLEANRSALALAEPASPGESPGTPLAASIAPVYYRTKAAYVLWMLRDLTGDDALASALRTALRDRWPSAVTPSYPALASPGEPLTRLPRGWAAPT